MTDKLREDLAAEALQLSNYGSAKAFIDRLLDPIEALADKLTGMADELDHSGDPSHEASAMATAYDCAAYMLRAALAGGGDRG